MLLSRRSHIIVAHVGSSFIISFESCHTRPARSQVTGAVVRREGRAGLGGGNDVNFCGATTTRLRSARDSSALTR